jgi:hypothetical protein
VLYWLYWLYGSCGRRIPPLASETAPSFVAVSFFFDVHVVSVGTILYDAGGSTTV